MEHIYEKKKYIYIYIYVGYVGESGTSLIKTVLTAAEFEGSNCGEQRVPVLGWASQTVT